MNDQPFAIKVENISKSFKLPHEKQNSLKSALINFKKRGYEKQEVLRNIDLEIKKGEFFGIVGRNGSGKSTLLKLLAGIYSPDEGEIHVRGKLTPFIELGVGFNPELTGRENVFLNGALLGFNRKEMAAMYDEIVEFAELERFMDQKLKNYSSGMQVRLAFSIAIRADSEILLLDEVLAVGDAIFQQKCFDYFKELKKKKKTVILVSHDSGALQQYCNQGVLIENGQIVTQGQITDVVNQYKELLIGKENAEPQPQASKQEKRWGTREIVVSSSVVLDEASTEKNLLTDKDNLLLIRVRYQANNACSQPVYGITINSTDGTQIFASNTHWSHMEVKDVRKGDILEITWEIPNIFNTGTYYVNPAVANETGMVMYDWRDSLSSFRIRKTAETTGEVNVKHKVSVINRREDA